MERFWRYKLDHAIFWIATVGFHMFTRADLIDRAGLSHFLTETIIRNGLLAGLIYFNLLVLIPRYAPRNPVLYTILLFGGLAAYVLLKNVHDVYLYGVVLGDEDHRHLFHNSYYNFSIAIFYLAFSIALHLSKAWYFQKELIRQMEVDKLNAELAYLKAQINPHFVFNSINTIYFQIDRQNEAARRSLLGFSEILRYQIYECNEDRIPIEKEISYLRNYVDLQRIRKDDNYRISFVEQGDLTDFTISPLLLIPFVENAFKHVSHFVEGNEIRVSLARSADSFTLRVFNTKEDRVANGQLYKGIGLNNVRRRLELLYRNRHELVVDDRPGEFEVRLVLEV